MHDGEDILVLLNYNQTDLPLTRMTFPDHQ
jgi:hypothetical protein